MRNKPFTFLILTIFLISCEKVVPEPKPSIVVVTQPQPQPQPNPVVTTPTPTQLGPPEFIGRGVILVKNLHPTKTITSVKVNMVLLKLNYPIGGKNPLSYITCNCVSPGTIVVVEFGGTGSFSNVDWWRFDTTDSTRQSNPTKLPRTVYTNESFYKNWGLPVDTRNQDQLAIVTN